jgi:hypothetical protein
MKGPGHDCPGLFHFNYQAKNSVNIYVFLF